MAATNDGYATGAAKDEAELRQRKVTSYEKTNGQHVYKVEAEDIKKKQKVRHVLTLPMSDLTIVFAAADKHSSIS